ncbi:MAG: CRISPR-associated endonuclease Cas3'' [Candidatus Bathyarchaeota archaeon]|nr:CRISPR-associated endonuclease Cas3'' [Candidatus Bathyarchaeota archaeon]
MMIYARYDGCREQMLHEHLNGAEKKIEKILSSHHIKHIILRLASDANVSFEDVTRAAKTAALFHDLGKAVHHYQRQKIEVCEGKRRSIGFSLHEVVSANFYAFTCLKYRENTCQFPFIQPWLTSLVMQAIILHHQGLRPITMEMLYSNRLSRIINEEPSKSAQNLQAVIQRVEKDSANYEPVKTLLSVARQDVSRMATFINPNAVQQLYNLNDLTQIQLSRVITACLMIADCWDVYETIGGRMSSYMRKAVIECLETLGVRCLAKESLG